MFGISTRSMLRTVKMSLQRMRVHACGNLTSTRDKTLRNRCVQYSSQSSSVQVLKLPSAIFLHLTSHKQIFQVLFKRGKKQANYCLAAMIILQSREGIVWISRKKKVHLWTVFFLSNRFWAHAELFGEVIQQSVGVRRFPDSMFTAPPYTFQATQGMHSGTTRKVMWWQWCF